MQETDKSIEESSESHINASQGCQKADATVLEPSVYSEQDPLRARSFQLPGSDLVCKRDKTMMEQRRPASWWHADFHKHHVSNIVSEFKNKERQNGCLADLAFWKHPQIRSGWRSPHTEQGTEASSAERKKKSRLSESTRLQSERRNPLQRCLHRPVTLPAGIRGEWIKWKKVLTYPQLQ